ncbi:hypothetical protein ABFS82_12G074800 [Erythranthe guttata]
MFSLIKTASPNSHKEKSLCFEIITMLLFQMFLFVQSSKNHEKYEACGPTTCGTDPPITIRYPFHLVNKNTKFCGYPGFHITCKENKTLVYKTSHGEYIIKNISYENKSFRLVNSKVLDSKCMPRLKYFSLDRAPFFLDQYSVDLKLLYSCDESFLKIKYGKYRVACDSNHSLRSYAVLDPERRIKCNEMACNDCVAAPVELNGASRNMSMDYMELLENGFMLKWEGISCGKCERSGGRCGFDEKNGAACFCRDRPRREDCYDGKS